jgi:hypothetical protein
MSFVSYVSQCTVGELVHSVRNHKDKEYSNESLLVFGNGDGGGGPTTAMIERLRRLKDIVNIQEISHLSFFILYIFFYLYNFLLIRMGLLRSKWVLPISFLKDLKKILRN